MNGDRLQLTFAERAEQAGSKVAAKLFGIMSAKESNLCVAVDETDAARFISIVEAIGPAAAVVKTHVDTIEGFTGKLTVDLANLAREHNFLIFEDRKFADIGQTVKNQYTKGIFHVIEWADIVNAHALPGPGIVSGLREEVEDHELLEERAILLLAQMSSKGNLIEPAYTKKVVALAKRQPDFVMGFIGAGLAGLAELAAITPPGFLIFAPGVKMAEGGDSLGQQYITPDGAVAAGADLLVVGRGIVADPKPIVAAEAYRQAGWEAYQRRITEPKVAKAA